MIPHKEIKMKNRLSHVVGLFLMGVFFLIFTGCTSSPQARFYMLSNPDPQPPAAIPSAGEPCLCIGIGPITIAHYLDRPQIATRTTANQIKLAEFDRWSETLKDSVTRMLENNISHTVCTKAILIFPWRGGNPIDYRIELHLTRLDGALGGDVFLEASWRIYSGDGKKMVISKVSRLTEPTSGKDYHAFVVAQSRALRNLSMEITEAIKADSKR
jgi:uncharacterized protein